MNPHLFLLYLRAATPYLFGALGPALFMIGPIAYAQQVTQVPPFIGTNSETWERFGIREIASGTSILGGIATISGDHMETATSFQLCGVFARPSDGQVFMDSDRPTGPVTISFSQPVSAFGAYWGSGVNCPACCGYPDAPSILTFLDTGGHIIGTDTFYYQGNGALMWRGYRFATAVKTIIRTAGDGQEGVAIDGLQATVPTPTSTPTPTPAAATAVVADFDGDGHTDWVVYYVPSRLTAILYLNDNVAIGANLGPTLPLGWGLRGAVDFNTDGHPDFGLFNPGNGQTAIWYLNNNVFVNGVSTLTLPSGWAFVATADFNADGKPDYVLYHAGLRLTVIVHMNNNVPIDAVLGPTLPVGWNVVGAADFDGDGHPDYALFNPTTGQTAIWYLNDNVFVSGTSTLTLPSGWALVAAADFNGDGKPDYVVYHAVSRLTAIVHMNNNVAIDAVLGPPLPAGWSLVALP